MTGVMQGVTETQSRSRSGSEQRDVNGSVQLRPYQFEALSAVESELSLVRSTLLVIPTGGGKTTVFSELVRRELSRGGRALVLAHREELLDQAQARLETFGVRAAIEQGARTAIGVRCVVGSVATLARPTRLAKFPRDAFTLVIADECQHAPAKSWTRVIEHFASARVLGVTATPDRADGTPLGDTFETIAYRYEIRDAIRDGYLVPIIARRVVVDGIDLSTLRKSGDFTNTEIAEVMEQQRVVEGVVAPLLDLASDRRTVGFAASVAHAHQIAEAINMRRAGAACVIHGELERAERKQRLADYAAGRYQFAINVDVLTEGWDDPPTSCVAMLRPTRSWGRFVQCAGRGLRTSPGKRDCLLIVFGDARTPGLIGPADCLTGRGDLADDVRAEIDRLIGTAQLDIGPVIEQAQAEVEKRRAAMRVHAVVQWHAERIDPFIGCDSASAESMPHRPEWRGEPATRPQLDALSGEGVNVEKMPQLTRAEAWDLLVRIKGRRKAGLCSYKMAKRLASLGVRHTATLTRERANELRDLCLQFGWHPNTLRDQPECLPSHATSRRDVGGAA